MRVIRFVILAGLIFTVGCSTTGAKYEASAYNVREIEASFKNSIAVGKFTRDESELVIDPWSFRGATKIASPVGDGHHDYIAKGIEDELMLARRLDSGSPLVLSGNLTEHIVDASGTNVGKGSVAMTFTLRNSGEIAYEDSKRVDYKWDSAFMGVTAATNAARAHLEMIERLINSLFQDAKFVGAVNADGELDRE